MGSAIATEVGRPRAVLLFGDEHVFAADGAGEGRDRNVARDRAGAMYRVAAGVRSRPALSWNEGGPRERFLYPDMQPIACMSSASATIDQLLGEIASLPLEDQALLHEVVGHRLVEARRREIADTAAAAREALERGEVRRGTTADLFADLGSDD